MNATQDEEDAVNALEDKIECARKAFNKAKFKRVQGQLENAIWLLQDCNAVFDMVFQVRRAQLQPDFYKLLHVERGVTPGELKKAYYSIARSLHPDNYEADITSAEKKRRQRLFQKVSEAYDVLSNAGKRQAFENGQYNQEEVQQRFGIHAQRRQASYDVPPDYVAGNGSLSDEDIKARLTEEQWYEYQKSRRRQ